MYTHMISVSFIILMAIFQFADCDGLPEGTH